MAATSAALETAGMVAFGVRRQGGTEREALPSSMQGGGGGGNEGGGP